MGVFELGISSLHFLEVVCFLKESCLTNGFEGFWSGTSATGGFRSGSSGPFEATEIELPERMWIPLFRRNEGPAVGPGAHRHLDDSGRKGLGE